MKKSEGWVRSACVTCVPCWLSLFHGRAVAASASTEQRMWLAMGLVSKLAPRGDTMQTQPAVLEVLADVLPKKRSMHPGSL